jgi:NitT/TauT family transport system substrate-binding protein
MPFLSQMPFHIAQEEGYFEAEGIEPEFVRVGRSQDLMAALARGEVDAVAGLLTVNELNTMAAGVRLRVVATLFALRPDQCDSVAVIARTGLGDSGALEDPDRVRDLVFDTDSLTHLGYQVDLLLRRYDLTIDDVKVVNLPPTAGLDAMQSNSVQAILENEPFLSQHLKAETSTIWVAGSELAPDYPHSVLIFGERLLDERPDLGERFATALLRGVRQFRDGKTPRNLEIVERASGLAPDVVRRACWPVAPDGALANADAVRGYQEWSVSRGLLDRVLDDGEVFDERFMRGAAATLDAGR